MKTTDPLNLFHYATKELSQDAVICWLIAHASKGNSPLRDHGRAFVRELFRAGAKGDSIPIMNLDGTSDCHIGNSSVGNVDLKSLRRQYRNMDVYFQARVDGKLVSFVIEDKTGTGAHSDQLARYLEIAKSDHLSKDLIKLVFFKTGFVFDDEREHTEKNHYAVFDACDLERFLDGLGDNVGSEILSEWRTHIREILAKRRESLANWDLGKDFVQWEFMKRLSATIERGVAEPLHLRRGRNRGGTPWTQYWFSPHLFWRLDAGKLLRLRVWNPRAQWNEANLRSHRESFRAALKGLRELRAGKERLRSGKEMTVGSVALDLEANSENKRLIEAIARLHEKFLKLTAL